MRYWLHCIKSLFSITSWSKPVSGMLQVSCTSILWTLRKHSTWCPEMEKYGIPPKKLIKMVNALYDVFSALRLRTTRYKVTAPFSLMTGVKQGCCISGFLFLFSIIIIDCVMQQTVKKRKQEFAWTSPLCLKTVALQMTTKLEDNSAKVGMKLNAKKYEGEQQ